MKLALNDFDGQLKKNGAHHDPGRKAYSLFPYLLFHMSNWRGEPRYADKRKQIGEPCLLQRRAHANYTVSSRIGNISKLEDFQPNSIDHGLFAISTCAADYEVSTALW